ncbi:MAG: hypothetical protein R6X32_21925 [Chloroflexota bacterium]|jgi:hypothetical protein
MTFSNRFSSSSIGADWSTNREQEVANLRLLLKQCDAWPDAGDHLLRLIAKSNWNAMDLKQEDAHYLPQVVEATLLGQDIGAQYPAFFQKLLSYPTLRQSFMNELSKNL